MDMPRFDHCSTGLKLLAAWIVYVRFDKPRPWICVWLLDNAAMEINGRGGMNSHAPMSLPSPPLAFVSEEKSYGLSAPRWSVVRPKLLPLSIAGLPHNGA